MAPRIKPDKTSAKITKKTTQLPEKVKKVAKEKAIVPKVPKKVGRKPWVPEYEKIEQWSLQGLTDKAIAALCKISTAEFCKKKTQLPQLKEALNYGKAKGEAMVSSKLFTMAMAGDREMVKMYLGRKCGWSETTINKNIDLSSIDGMTPEELDDLESKLGL